MNELAKSATSGRQPAKEASAPNVAGGCVAFANDEATPRSAEQPDTETVSPGLGPGAVAEDVYDADG